MTLNCSILIIGSGGREHAICWKLAQSDLVQNIFVAPGNSGIAKENKTTIVPLDVTNNKVTTEWCIQNKINMVVIGPENFLHQGLADELGKFNIPCFGPSKLAAKIETDKCWSKAFMDRHDIPTASWKSFSDAVEAKNFVKESSSNSLVIKASGLAAGKGVVVAKSKDEAYRAIEEILEDKKFGAAGNMIIIEEVLEGEEVSALAFTDGKTVVMMTPAQDHKRIFNHDQGPNTGGMGAYCPCSFLTKEDNEFVITNILKKTVDGMRTEGIPFVGVLYAGLMMTQNGPKVLEFNCRFGDPETQVILPLLQSDLYVIMKSCCEGNLKESYVSWKNNIFSTGVILASKGYPEYSSKGQVIEGIEEILCRDDHYVFHSGTSISESQQILTNGGRVLIVVALAPSLALSAARATAAAGIINFDGKQYRTDIAHKGIARSILEYGTMTYKTSGVDIEAGDTFVTNIKPAVSTTMRSGVIGNIGGFGSIFDINALGFQSPLLVSGTDGVGTKLKIALEYKKHDTVGIDLVAMCVNDVLAQGAEPLYFLDYFACSKLEIDVAEKVITGIAEGCKQAGCALVGGETAEMPDMYSDGEYDLAGFAVGAVEKSELLPKIDSLKSGDIVIGIPSSGIHSNGFSLVRKIFSSTNMKLTDLAPFSNTKLTFGEEFLKPTKIYVKNVIPAMKQNLVKGFAHITGGGLSENIPRILPNDLGVILNAEKWNILPVFSWLAMMGGISKKEMLKTFNCGIGAIIICAPEHQSKIMDIIKSENPSVIGHVCSLEGSSDKVRVENFETQIDHDMRKYVSPIMKHLTSLKKVGVLISGSGTNLQALIDATKNVTYQMGAEIVLVISNKPGVKGLDRAHNAGIKTKVIKHVDYKDREAFDKAMDTELVQQGVDIICLAGFMRILSPWFVKKWRGAIINIHPSLLPSFKGANAHEEVLKYGARVSGCTVHFVNEDIDSGAIIEQEAVPVMPTDTKVTLEERIKKAEHKVFPKALKLLATNQIKLKDDNTIEWLNL
ncbi:trifunctional purine biosynthetic protein adenosine-3 [Trichogramma pretiosum]|uniref:trifunctional purine biosynthetic protein adenosine-3 n=1 Tax=Trichogramma pretiosum TaxID=7493 RepID=UPI0006C94C3B|nr:trifunctional purine biosynthetic protein adenosine-3 [Trichogramma pretiosum]XP_014223028.1 trifunctional purine biosynthetic protein adenosine-3 [Trichogramma pretiosum]XP_014223029.1 trifunctional purine biosynthetic protein adenosine-3 [Trichogramma pretiosum]